MGIAGVMSAAADQQSDRLLRRLPGAVRHQRHRRAKARRSPSSAPTAPARPLFCDASPAAADAAGHGAVRRPPIGALDAARDRPARHRDGAGRPPAVSDRFRSRKTCCSAATASRPGPWNLERVYRAVSALAGRRQLPATGAVRRPAADGRDRPALMANPRLLLCDEISLGLAPIVIRDIYAALADITRRRHHACAGRAGHQPRAAMRRPRLLPSGRPRGVSRPRRPRILDRATRSRAGVFRIVRPATIGWTLAQHHHSRRAARRPLCAVRHRAVDVVRHHAARQHRAWRPHRALGLCRAGGHARHRPAIRS